MVAVGATRDEVLGVSRVGRTPTRVGGPEFRAADLFQRETDVSSYGSVSGTFENRATKSCSTAFT